MFGRLATRLIGWSLILTGSVYITTIGLSNRAGRRAALAAAEREAYNATDAAALEVEGALQTVEESVAALARTAPELQPGPDALERLVRRFAADQGERVLRYEVILAPADVAPAPAWYRETLKRGTPGWTEPYLVSEGAEAVVITRTAPVRADDGRLTGVAAATLRLDFLSAALRKVHLGASGFALALSRDRLIIGHSQMEQVEALLNPVASLSPALRAQVEPIVRRAEAGEEGFVAVPLNNRLFRITVRPIAQTGGVLATLYAEDELLADVSALRRTQIWLAASGLAGLAGAIVLLSRRITGPLAELASSARGLATGNLDAPLPAVTSRDEIGDLTEAFRNMRDSLKVYIHNLEKTTATKERLETELRAARQIQADMLPLPAAGGESAGYELAAALVPAHAVGGDLFDHFTLGRLVFFLVADVSGKGVPAALFMARTKTLFDAVAETEHNPGAVLRRLNQSLCTQNQTGMYVTAVCGVLDVDERTVTFATAGHEPPVLVRAGGRSIPLQGEGGRVLGLIEGGDYPVIRLPLQPGDAVVLYTDGVSEAQDPSGAFFGAERVLAATARVATGNAMAITNGLMQEVKAFAATAPQFDDVTILTLKLA
jgi:sigma-B regulation protein RsbU (phosphoserine phosphatase)